MTSEKERLELADGQLDPVTLSVRVGSNEGVEGLESFGEFGHVSSHLEYICFSAWGDNIEHLQVLTFFSFMRLERNGLLTPGTDSGIMIVVIACVCYKIARSRLA